MHGILCRGPASGAAGGEILFSGGTLGAEVDGLDIEQRVDMIWRRPGGVLEAVLVFEEPLTNGRPRPATDDWRCILAAAVVRALYGQNPDVHAVWVSGAAARVARIPEEVLDERLGTLVRTLARARDFRGLENAGEGAFYSLAAEPPSPGVAGARRGQRSRGSARRGND